MAQPQIADPFAQVNAAATQAPVVDPFAAGYEKPKGPLARGVSAAYRGFTSGADATLALAQNAAGATEAGKASLDAAKRESDLGAKDSMRVEDVNSFGGALDFLQYALGYLGTQLGANVVAGAGGRILGGLGARAVGATAATLAAKQAGTVAGLAGSSLMQEIGQIYPDAVANGVQDPIQRSLLGAAIAAAADVLPEAYVARRAGILGKAERGSGPLKEAIKVGAGEAGTELFQTYIERASSGQPVSGPEAFSDYLNSAVLGAFGGTIAGGVAGAYNQTKSTLDNSTSPQSAAQPVAPGNASVQPVANPVETAQEPVGPPVQTFSNTPASMLSLDIPADNMRAEDLNPPRSDVVPALEQPLLKTSEPQAVDLGPTPAPSPAPELITPRPEPFQRNAIDILRDNLAARERGPVQVVEQTPSSRTTTAEERLAAPLPPAEPAPKTPFTEPPVIIGGLEVHPGGPQQIIVKPPMAEPIPGFQQSATDLIAERTQPTPQLVDPFAVSTTPREVVKTFDARAAREQAMEKVAQITDQQVQKLQSAGLIKDPKAASAVAANIRRSAQQALTEKDADVAKQAVSDGVMRALRGRVEKVDAERIASEYSSALDEIRLQSKAATRPELAQALDRYSRATEAVRAATPDKVAELMPELDASRVAAEKAGATTRDITQVREGPRRPMSFEEIAALDRHNATLRSKAATFAPRFAEGDVVRFDGRALDGSTSGSFDVRVVNPHSNAAAVTAIKGARAYEGAVQHIPTVTVQNVRTGRVFEANEHNLSATAVTARSRAAAFLTGTPEQVDTMLRTQGDAAIARVQDIVGTPDNLKIDTYLSDRGAGAIRLGKLRDVIELNLNAKDILSVANHEAFHYLEHRVLPKADLDAVKNAFRINSPMWNKLIERVRQYDQAHGTQLETEVRGVPAEARAYAFEFWHRGELAAQGIVERAFRAIRRAIERVQNWVNGSGFQSYEDVFDAIDRGYYAQRYGSPFENVKLRVPEELRLASEASLNEMAQRAKVGEIPQTQLNARIAELLDNTAATGDVRNLYLERAMDEAKGFTGALKRFYLSKVSSGENLARHSAGYKNVFNALTTYAQRKNRLIADGVEKQLSKWVKQATAADKEVVAKALLDRTVNGYATGSSEYESLRARLTPYQREMFDQATQMIASRLEDEFVADQAAYARALGPDTEQYREWFENRRAQVDALKQNGYFPERRYGDHVVHAYVEGPDGKRITLYYSQHEREADARSEERDLKRALEAEPGVKVDYGYRYRAEYDGSISFQQFLDMAQRHGVAITQAERERLAKALVAADSIRRNRLFRRKNIAGYSEDGMRVLAEFGVAMANKIAYHELGGAINDAIAGRAVTAQFDRTGAVKVATDPNVNLWDADGPMGGYFRNLSDKTADFVLSPRSQNAVSRGLRAMASVQFLGGSISAAMVQLTSMAMNTTPWLVQHTNYTDALGRSFAGYKLAMSQHKMLTDLPTLLNDSVRIEGVDDVDGLRHALQIAAQDGTTLDTEIYQIMGLSRGQEYSLSGRVQQAVKAWMTPFRITEQWNRTGTFIAAFKLAKDQKMSNDAAYKFAQESVYATQFRYDEANRPALARGDVGSLLFVFKSYPIFMLETMAHLAKVSPSAAVTMTLTLALMSGVEGLPFAEDIEDLVDTIAQRVFGSPFNTKRALRNVLKSASEAVVGADLSSVMMHGVANELTGLSFASRVGMGNLIPGTRIGAADADYKRTMGEILGPIGTIVTGSLAGADSLSKGGFVQAAQQALPLAAQNLIKGWQDWKQGYASDLGGRKLMDVTGWEAFWQAFGFSSSALSRAYESDRIDKQTLAFYQQARTDFTRDLVKAVREGDSDKASRIADSISAWNTAHPEMPIAVSPASVRRDVMLAGLPMNQRTARTLPRQLRGGSEYVLGLESQ